LKVKWLRYNDNGKWLITG